MKMTHRLAVIAIVALSALCAPLSHAQHLVLGNMIEFGQGAEVGFGTNGRFDRPLLRFASGTMANPANPSTSLMEIGRDGSVEFFNNATVDFAGFVEGVHPGALRGWIAVRVAGELVIFPAFRLVAAVPAAPGGQ